MTEEDTREYGKEDWERNKSVGGGKIEGNEGKASLCKTNKHREEGNTLNNDNEFKKCIEEIRSRFVGGWLLHNESTVNLIVKTIKLSPPTLMYPHPDLSALFEGMREIMSVEGECVASWASREAKGLKASIKDFPESVIVGIYGGKLTKEKGMYTLDVTMTGGENRMVDGHPNNGEVAILGRINEDIHKHNLNTCFDIAGITYTTSIVRRGCEFLTTYGDGYRWDNVVEIGYRRMREDLIDMFPGMTIGIPEQMAGLRSSNPLHAWVKEMVWDSADMTAYHSTYDSKDGQGIDMALSFITSNVAYNRYAFRRCGLPEPVYSCVTIEERRHTNNYKRALLSRLDVPFKNVVKANERIATLRNHVVNAKLIQITGQVACEEVTRDEIVGTGDAVQGKMLELVNDMRGRFPWAARHIDECLAHGPENSSLGRAMLDITLDRLSVNDLHSCGNTRDWFLADGMATFLRSGLTYQRYNPHIRVAQTSSKDETVKGKEIPLIRWCPNEISNATNRTLLRVNGGVRKLARDLKMQMEFFQTTCPLRGNEEISGQSGRIRITFNNDTDGEYRAVLRNLNSIPMETDVQDIIASLPIWKVEIKHKEQERLIDTDVYSGYVAMDQIIRDRDQHNNIRTSIGSMEIIESARKLRGEPVRVGWKEIHISNRNPQEVVQWMIDMLEQGRHELKYPWFLQEHRGLPQEHMAGMCGKFQYSSWRKEGDGWLYIEDNHISSRRVNSEVEWDQILPARMLCRRKGNFYVRKGGLGEDYTKAMAEAKGKLLDLMIRGVPRIDLLQSSIAPTVVALHSGVNRDSIEASMIREISQDLKGGLDRDIVDRLALRMEEEWTGSEAYGSAVEDICRNLNIPLVCMQGNKSVLKVEGGGEKRTILMTQDGTCVLNNNPDPKPEGTIEKLKVLFWNSNGWDITKAQKISSLATEEKAHVICILDTRQDMVDAPRKLSTILFYLNIKTGMKWSGEASPTIKGTKVGGSFVLHSEHIKDPKHSRIIEGGVLDELRGKWGGKHINIISMYRPAGDNADGSLRKAAKKLLGDDMDKIIIDRIESVACNPHTMIGGDFNLDPVSASRLMLKAGLKGVLCEGDGAPTFRRLVKGNVQESVIDHVMWTGDKLSGQYVVKDGQFVTDHIPVIGWVDHTITRSGEKRKSFMWLPKMKSGDKTIAEKYKKSIARSLEDINIDDMDLPDIVKMAVNTSIKMGKKRGGGVQGWSPLSRLMEVQKGLAGTAVKSFGKSAYNIIMQKRIKQASLDIRGITLNEDEIEWKEQNIKDVPTTWQQWKLEYPTKALALGLYTKLQAMLTEQRRKDLRILHGGKMRKLQEAADEGKIGGILDKIVGGKIPFVLDSIKDGDEIVNDPKEVTKRVTKLFRDWFFRNEGDAARDHGISDAVINNDRDKFLEITESLKIPPNVAEQVWNSCCVRETSHELLAESEGLDEYTPSLSEFKSFIQTSNPRSAGGYNGLSYHMLQHLPEKLLDRVYEILATAWKERTTIEGWGDRWLVPIPKILNPSLKDLRPIMLVDVIRKVWVGLLMDRIRIMWDKWGLINESQHGFMTGKGTDTAIPHIISLFETARQNNASLYISSWDITRAFDSLGRETVIMALLRLHVPRPLAEYITGIDRTGRVYVRTPSNYDRHYNMAEGGDLKEEDGFKTLKGVGQGDIPSPLLWAAAFDILLCALNVINSNFSVLDLGYNSHEGIDVCYADDLISAVATLMELQAKADVVSAWCLIMGVKISHAKFRTFGMDWGTKKKVEGKLIIHTEGWTEVLVDVRGEGVLTHLGMIWNTDMNNKELWRGIVEKVQDLGWRIARTWVRPGDKMMAMNYCLKTNICYRLQFGIWDLKKCKKLDAIYLRIVRNITKNMKGYPALPIMSDKEFGGLGIETPTMRTHKRKIRIIMSGLGKGGMTGVHIENLLRIELEKTGLGGIPNQEVRLRISDGRVGYVTSLVEWLDEIGLAIHLPGMIYNSPYATYVRVAEKGLMERDSVQLRRGQVWEIDGGLLEISSIANGEVRGVRLTGLGRRPTVGSVVERMAGDIKGGDGIYKVKMEEIKKYKRIASLECSPMGRGPWKRRIEGMRHGVPTRGSPNEMAPLAQEWKGFSFDTIFTDGSWKVSETVRDILSGKRQVRTGGAVVLNKGDKYITIRVDIDVETGSAFEAELISLLVAMEIAGQVDVTIYSDCRSALSVLLGRNKGTFFSLLSGWRKKAGVLLEKVKAHPERYREPKDWTNKDRGIWIADQIAGGDMEASHIVKASDWLRKVAFESKAYISKQGLPFVKDISKEWGKLMMDRYLNDRDDYRERDGRDRIWGKANLKYIHKMIGRNQTIADRAAAQRAGLGKIWRWHRHREDNTCEACGDKYTTGILHPIRLCKNTEIIQYREKWRKGVDICIKKMPHNVRETAKEVWRSMEINRHGEYACCGVFLEDFCEELTRADEELDRKGKSAFMGLLKVIGNGAREILRIHTGVNIVNRMKSLTQMSITTYFNRIEKRELYSDEEEEKGKKRQNKRSYKGRSKYINPVESESESDGEDIRIRNPPSPKIVFSNYIKVIKPRLVGDSPEYWEWKAG